MNNDDDFVVVVKLSVAFDNYSRPFRFFSRVKLTKQHHTGYCILTRI